MEDNHYVIKYIHLSSQIIGKVPMTRNHVFPLRIVPDNTRVRFKEESKEELVDCDKKENDSADFQAAFQTEVQVDSWLWHFRFGHLNFGELKLLHTKNMVKGFPFIDKLDRVCEVYIFGKQHRETFPVGKSYRARTPLEIVHSDICGPMQT